MSMTQITQFLVLIILIFIPSSYAYSLDDNSTTQEIVDTLLSSRNLDIENKAISLLIERKDADENSFRLIFETQRLHFTVRFQALTMLKTSVNKDALMHFILDLSNGGSTGFVTTGFVTDSIKYAIEVLLTQTDWDIEDLQKIKPSFRISNAEYIASKITSAKDMIDFLSTLPEDVQHQYMKFLFNFETRTDSDILNLFNNQKTSYASRFEILKQDPTIIAAADLSDFIIKTSNLDYERIAIDVLLSKEDATEKDFSSIFEAEHLDFEIRAKTLYKLGSEIDKKTLINFILKFSEGRHSTIRMYAIGILFDHLDWNIDDLIRISKKYLGNDLSKEFISLKITSSKDMTKFLKGLSGELRHSCLDLLFNLEASSAEDVLSIFNSPQTLLESRSAILKKYPDLVSSSDISNSLINAHNLDYELEHIEILLGREDVKESELKSIFNTEYLDFKVRHKALQGLKYNIEKTKLVNFIKLSKISDVTEDLINILLERSDWNIKDLLTISAQYGTKFLKGKHLASIITSSKGIRSYITGVHHNDQHEYLKLLLEIDTFTHEDITGIFINEKTSLKSRLEILRHVSDLVDPVHISNSIINAHDLSYERTAIKILISRKDTTEKEFKSIFDAEHLDHEIRKMALYCLKEGVSKDSFVEFFKKSHSRNELFVFLEMTLSSVSQTSRLDVQDMIERFNKNTNEDSLFVLKVILDSLSEKENVSYANLDFLNSLVETFKNPDFIYRLLKEVLVDHFDSAELKKFASSVQSSILSKIAKGELNSPWAVASREKLLGLLLDLKTVASKETVTRLFEMSMYTSWDPSLGARIFEMNPDLSWLMAIKCREFYSLDEGVSCLELQKRFALQVLFSSTTATVGGILAVVTPFLWGYRTTLERQKPISVNYLRGILRPLVNAGSLVPDSVSEILSFWHFSTKELYFLYAREVFSKAKITGLSYGLYYAAREFFQESEADESLEQ